MGHDLKLTPNLFFRQDSCDCSGQTVTCSDFAEILWAEAGQSLPRAVEFINVNASDRVLALLDSSKNGAVSVQEFKAFVDARHKYDAAVNTHGAKNKDLLALDEFYHAIGNECAIGYTEQTCARHHHMTPADMATLWHPDFGKARKLRVVEEKRKSDIAVLEGMIKALEPLGIDVTEQKAKLAQLQGKPVPKAEPVVVVVDPEPAPPQPDAAPAIVPEPVETVVNVETVVAPALQAVEAAPAPAPALLQAPMMLMSVNSATPLGEVVTRSVRKRMQESAYTGYAEHYGYLPTQKGEPDASPELKPGFDEATLQRIAQIEVDLLSSACTADEQKALRAEQARLIETTPILKPGVRFIVGVKQ